MWDMLLLREGAWPVPAHVLVLGWLLAVALPAASILSTLDGPAAPRSGAGLWGRAEAAKKNL